MPSPVGVEWEQIPEAMQKQLEMTQVQFEAIRDGMKAREARTPAAGTEAPDFELKRLTEKGDLTEHTLRLSSLRGRPVGLVFGSYT